MGHSRWELALTVCWDHQPGPLDAGALLPEDDLAPRGQTSGRTGAGHGALTHSPLPPTIEASDGEPPPEAADRDLGEGEGCSRQPVAPNPPSPEQDLAARGPASQPPAPGATPP